MRVPRKEEGAALLAVLLLVAVMSALSVLALEKLRLSTRLAANGAALEQARAFAFGVEALAVGRISDLAQRDRGKTTLAGGWHGRLTRLPLPGGFATARVTDGGNCFNLNSVASGTEPTGLVARPTGVFQFAALMRLLGVADADARRVAASLADWIDADEAPNPEGAEDGDYAQAAIPYRAANTLLAEPSELRAVAGVTPEIYAKVRPWVCALPTTDLSPLNVNTLSPDRAVLLAMLIPDQLDIARARQILAERPAAGWDTMIEFWTLPGLGALDPSGDVYLQPRLNTRWFALDLDVELAGAQVTETALVDAGLSPARMVARRWGSDE